MGNCVLYITSETPLPGGEKMVRGLATPSSSYAASGEGLNLANYFSSSSSPTVMVENPAGRPARHDQGTASAGKVLFYQMILNTTTVNSTAANVALYECHTALNLSGANIAFLAVGQNP